jgi:hypothetical protein
MPNCTDVAWLKHDPRKLTSLLLCFLGMLLCFLGMLLRFLGMLLCFLGMRLCRSPTTSCAASLSTCTSQRAAQQGRCGRQIAHQHEQMH